MKIASDKLGHMLVCFTISIWTGVLAFSFLSDFTMFFRLVLTSLPALLWGAGKEWYDSLHPEKHTAEWGDFIADIVGILPAILLIELTRYFV